MGKWLGCTPQMSDSLLNQTIDDFSSGMKHGCRYYDDAMLMMWMVRQRWTGARDGDDDDDGVVVVVVVVVVKVVVVVVVVASVPKSGGFKLSVFGAPGP